MAVDDGERAGLWLADAPVPAGEERVPGSDLTVPTRSPVCDSYSGDRYPATVCNG